MNDLIELLLFSTTSNIPLYRRVIINIHYVVPH